MINDKWMSLSTQQVEEKLNTSAASGLSRKAARERFQKAGENAFFLFPYTSPKQCVRSVIMQPSIILLLSVSILFMLFEKGTTGQMILGLTLVCVCALIAMRMWTGYAYRINARASRPLVRVIREGQLFLLDCTRIVPGDVIELHQGDTVPYDARLVGSSKLQALTYLGEQSATRYATTSKIGSDSGISYAVDICEHTNMIYGGSVIEHGYSRALVVETGKHTYIGALQGGFPIKAEPGLPSTVEKLKKIASRLQIVLLLSILPIMCLSLLIGKTDVGLPLLFSSLICLCLANLSGHMDILFSFGMAIGVRRALSKRDGNMRALVKTEKSPDQIADIDILFMFGPQAFSSYQPMSEEDTATVARAGEEYKTMIRSHELRLALGNQFLTTREEHLQHLHEAGIHPILILETESKQSITYIQRTGIVENTQEIAYASKFHTNKMPITSNFGNYKAYCGFSNEELRSLMIHLQKLNEKIAVLGCTPRESDILAQADVRFVCVNDLTHFSDPHRAREKNPLIRRKEELATLRMRQCADVLIPCADQHHGGIASITHALQTAADTTHNLTNMIRYLIYAQIVRTLFILPPILLGVHMIQPAQAVLSGLCLDLLLSFMMLSRVGTRNLNKIRSSSSFRLQTVWEAIFASGITMMIFGGIYSNYTDSATASYAMLVSMLSIQITYFLICWNPFVSMRRSANRRSILLLFLICLFFWPITKIIGISTPLGVAALSAPYAYLILIGPISVVTTFFIIHFYRVFRSR